MDDARIRELTNEVMAALERSPAGGGTTSLEARVSALETAVARLLAPAIAAAPVAAAPAATGHVSLRVLDVPGGGERCVLEPDRPCTHSGTCRTLGH